ncbi:hypothetical protein GS518_06460 [Leptospira interrogans]|uniref:Uncharacterized protein n=19 Tax=Leptospira interrogans TaxID=173 RepID=Q8F2P8_LEPIN|nr:hypothetical protein LA_2720 [Leptospira interrogans serovar Lai str. 56601]AER03011.1 hypothetical protein LIF_A2222 [Leptospira interrogans serovar Lai str. IPAV]AKH76803.1 hypothetical protein BRAT_06910 [Leptospira interrogans serovar Bratislava]AKP25587.1 hypothetical protein LIMLP_06320 [Leptospira interrogans serovar Manilae]ALE40000.1 hypothetical protein G436_2832 [Leptospira interrogans serovar Hardjo str. Norma]ALO01034.1 hypothetical protein LIH_11775 [Leptospira interrogans ser
MIDAKNLKSQKESDMSYKMDGAKFQTMEELIDAFYPLYSDTMSEDDFEKYVQENAKEE